MSRLAELHKLTEDIANSYDDRMARLATRQQRVDEALSATRKQVTDLHSSRIEAAAVLHSGLRKDRAARHSAATEQIATSGLARAAMADHQRSALAEAKTCRRAEVNDMRSQVQKAMQENGVARLADEFARKAALRCDRADLSGRVADLLGGVRRARLTMAAEQRASLSQGRAQLAGDSARYLSEAGAARSVMVGTQRETLLEARAARQAEVCATLGKSREVRKELVASLADLRGTWRNFSTLMRAKRAGSTVGLVAEMVAERSPVVRANGATARAVPEATIAVDELAISDVTLSDESVFRYLADHPDGLRLVELENHFDVQRFLMVSVVGRLMEQNKARKDDERKLYFAT